MISERAKRAGIKELEIFDNFQVDSTLPKYGIKENNGAKSQGAYISFDNASTQMNVSAVSTGSFGTPTNIWVTPNEAVPMNDPIGFSGSNEKRSFKKWLLRKLDNKGKTTRKRITIFEFFTRLTSSYEELVSIAEIAKYYETALLQSNGMGQTALTERLKDNLEVVKGEAVLISKGIKKYVTEKQVVDYYEKVGSDKNLKLTWIKNFGRIIPEKVFEIKKELDALKIFDNYVVLHYDPKDDGIKLTKKEIEKKKDPILFGVIKNSKKLYFVADWKDEYCDLTLDEMFKVLKGKILEINNKTVKAYIDKIKA